MGPSNFPLDESWSPTAGTPRLRIDLPCREGEMVKIVISSEKEEDGLIRPHDNEFTPLIRLKES